MPNYLNHSSTAAQAAPPVVENYSLPNSTAAPSLNIPGPMIADSSKNKRKRWCGYAVSGIVFVAVGGAVGYLTNYYALGGKNKQTSEAGYVPTGDKGSPTIIDKYLDDDCDDKGYYKNRGLLKKDMLPTDLEDIVEEPEEPPMEVLNGRDLNERRSIAGNDGAGNGKRQLRNPLQAKSYKFPAFLQRDLHVVGGGKCDCRVYPRPNCDCECYCRETNPYRGPSSSNGWYGGRALDVIEEETDGELADEEEEEGETPSDNGDIRHRQAHVIEGEWDQTPKGEWEQAPPEEPWAPATPAPPVEDKCYCPAPELKSRSSSKSGKSGHTKCSKSSDKSTKSSKSSSSSSSSSSSWSSSSSKDDWWGGWKKPTRSPTGETTGSPSSQPSSLPSSQPSSSSRPTLSSAPSSQPSSSSQPSETGVPTNEPSVSSVPSFSARPSFTLECRVLAIDNEYGCSDDPKTFCCTKQEERSCQPTPESCDMGPAQEDICEEGAGCAVGEFCCKFSNAARDFGCVAIAPGACPTEKLI